VPDMSHFYTKIIKVAANCINSRCGGLAELLRQLQAAGAPSNL